MNMDKERKKRQERTGKWFVAPEFPNGGNLALVTNRQHPPHFCIETPDAELYGELVEHRDGTKTTYIKDPDDNVVELLLEET